MKQARGWVALALCAALCLGLVPGRAETAEAADAALMAVTARVKTRLELDTDGFTDFQGWSDEDVLLGRRWHLSWEGDGVGLSVTADDSGKVYSYYRSDLSPERPVAASEYGWGGRFTIPALPEDKSAAARAAAEEFLGKVLEGPVETVAPLEGSAPALRQTAYRFSGTLLLNGLPSPISYSLTVRADDLAVTHFWRGDEGSGYLGALPAADAVCTAQQARAALQGTLKLEAKYVLEDDGKSARVCWVSVSGDQYYVDGATGELVDLTQLQRELWDAGRVYGAANLAMDLATSEEAETGGLKELSQAEKDGAAILADALSREELDGRVQAAWPAIGLARYTLSSASYALTPLELPEGQVRTSEDYRITCRLSYGCKEGDVLKNKTVTVDAKTGELQSLWSSRRYQGGEKDSYALSTSLADGQRTAEDFLRAFAGERYAKLALFSSTPAEGDKIWRHSYQFQHKANGYFYDGNAYTVEVDATDGTLCTLYGAFDDAVTLVRPARVISHDDAVAAYAAALEVPYGYLEVPVSVSLAGAEVAPLLKEAGYSYVLSLKNGYTLSQPKNSYVTGVDAETGQACIHTGSAEDERTIAYTDLSGHWVQSAAQALAAFRIGFAGGTLQPAQTLTQRDLIALLASVNGYWFDPTHATREEVDALYQTGYSLGLVTPETRDEGKVITRGELVKVILDAAGYQQIAALEGIFRCRYSDADTLDAATLGYAALAQGLGLVQGGSDGAYAPGRAITRAEAVAMLYQYMSRR